ncbi:MAG: Holliday junction resolvase RuvX [Chthonomonadales bacterium]
MGRVMAVDVGERRIGLAFSDEMKTFPAVQQTLERQEGYRADMRRIRQLVEESNVELVVVGLPLHLDGSAGTSAHAAREFAEALRRYVAVPVLEVDERLSTVEAERMLLHADVGRKKRRQVVDGVAAGVILQAYLDAIRKDGQER